MGGKPKQTTRDWYRHCPRELEKLQQHCSNQGPAQAAHRILRSHNWPLPRGALVVSVDGLHVQNPSFAKVALEVEQKSRIFVEGGDLGAMGPALRGPKTPCEPALLHQSPREKWGHRENLLLHNAPAKSEGWWNPELEIQNPEEL